MLYLRVKTKAPTQKCELLKVLDWFEDQPQTAHTVQIIKSIKSRKKSAKKQLCSTAQTVTPRCNPSDAPSLHKYCLEFIPMLHEWQPLPNHCPGWGCFGLPFCGKRVPNTGKSMDVIPAGSGVRGRWAQKWPKATKVSWGPAKSDQCSCPPCPWSCHSFEHPSGGSLLASAETRCTLLPPRGWSSLLWWQQLTRL